MAWRKGMDLKQSLRRAGACLILAAALAASAAAQTPLERDFTTPPDASKAWCYWWWLNGCVTHDGILRELDHMKEKGIGGALVFHAGTGDTPFQVEFMSPQWRELFAFTVREAAKRKIVIGFNVCGGWNAGGPWVKPEEAAQTLGFKAVLARGPHRVTLVLPSPKPPQSEYYRDVAVLAWQYTIPVKGQPALCRRETMVDLTSKLQGDQLTWDAPAGNWVVVRFGHYVHPRAHTKCTGGESYLELDPLRADAMDRHFQATVGVLLADVKEHVGKTFQYLHIDSGEIGKPDWTPAFREEFRKRRGYDPFPCLAARARMDLDSPALTERFNEDYERTLGELMVQNYYGRLTELAHQHGLGTHSEAAGFQKPCVDALASLGINDISMSEFWVRRSDASDQYIHQLAEAQLRSHDGIRTAAAAAHTYGRPIVQAEAWTVMAGPADFPNYDKDPFALKDTGDRAFCAGLNRAMLCFMVAQPSQTDQPGYEWPKVGTEFNRHVTWWRLGAPWLTYLARCQSLLQAGAFAADACYFPGEWVPDYVPARWAMNPPLPPGFDCDTVNAAGLRAGARAGGDGALTLASGMHYRYLVLNQGGRWRPLPAFNRRLGLGIPNAENLDTTEGKPSLAVTPATLKKLKELVEDGVTLVGPRPARAIGLTAYPASDQEISRLANALWGPDPAASGRRTVGKGRVIWGKNLAEIFAADKLTPDLEIREDAPGRALTSATLNGIPNPGGGSFDWIHRRLEGAEAYFIANLRSVGAGGDFTFRAGGQPELWDPLSGSRGTLPEFSATTDGRLRLPLRFAPRQSFFIVFRTAAQATTPAKPSLPGQKNFPTLQPVLSIGGAWDVAFDPKWGGPAKVSFDRLLDWTQRPEEGIRHYSGLATYKKTFTLPESAIQVRSSGGASRPQSAIYLDLGTLHNLAQVRLNGQDLGVVWTAPWRVEITKAARSGENQLEIDVVNLWPNRLIGDAALPPEKRFTKTNIPAVAIKPDAPLYPSGLLGPVTIQTEAATGPRPARKAPAAKAKAEPLASARKLAEALPCTPLFFEVAGRPAFLLKPQSPANGKPIPWLWYAPTLAGTPHANHIWMFKQFLEHGIAIAGIDVGESCGNPEGRALYQAFYEELRAKHGVAARAVLMPQSRGGLMLYNWAAEHPRAVAAVAGIYTVSNLESWPGLNKASAAYGMPPESLAAHLAEHNPIDRLRPLAEAGVPILHIHGDSDTVVPLARHSAELARRYQAFGGNARVIIVKGLGHQVAPEFFQCQEVADFVIKQAHARAQGE